MPLETPIQETQLVLRILQFNTASCYLSLANDTMGLMNRLWNPWLKQGVSSSSVKTSNKSVARKNVKLKCSDLHSFAHACPITQLRKMESKFIGAKTQFSNFFHNFIFNITEFPTLSFYDILNVSNRLCAE